MRQVLALVLLLTTSAPLAAQRAAPRLEPGLSVIGASVSAGFGSGYDLADILSAALGAELPIQDAADSTLFFGVEERGRKMIDAALVRRREIVIAMDFLFWYAAGAKDLETRKADLGKALAEIDRLPGRVVLGTIPHMRKASRLMLPESRRVPAVEIRALNAWLEEQTATRERVRLLRIDRWVDAIEEDRLLPEFERIGLSEIDRERFLQRDGLHLSRDGLLLAAALVLDDLSTHELKGREVLRDLAALGELLKNDDRSIEVEVFEEDMQPSVAGLIRFDLPTMMEMRASGLELGDLMKLRELRSYAEPTIFEGSNLVGFTGIPAAAARLEIRVRAERGPSLISRWSEIDLGRAESRIPLVLHPAPELRLKILDGKNATALPGALVAVPDEIEARGLRLSRLAGEGPGFATTDELGIAVLVGVGPDAKEILVRRPDGTRVTLPLERGDDPIIVRLPAPAQEESERP